MAVRGIGVALLDQLADHADHLRRYDCGGARLDVGGSASSAAMSSWKASVGARGQRVDRLAVLGGAVDDLVVDVGDVADIGDALG